MKSNNITCGIKKKLIECFDHSLYKHTNNLIEADGISYTFVNKEKSVFFPYKSPILQPNELRANILYTGVCIGDLIYARSNQYDNFYPLTPGHEIIAEVNEVGSEVSNFKKGDKVAFGSIRQICGTCKICKIGKGDPLCEGSINKYTYGLHWGGFSTLIQQPSDFFVPIPIGLDLERSAPLLCAGLTVYSPIKKYLKPGYKCAVIGIGGLGHMALQFLSKMGHEVTGITTDVNKTDFIKSLGASETIISKDITSIIKSEGKFDLVISTIPTIKNFSLYFNLVSSGGTFVALGYSNLNETFEISASDLISKEKKLVGGMLGSREDIVEMFDFCHKHNIYPIIELFTFDEFDKALDKVEYGKPNLRCVVKIGERFDINNFK